jgi:hypothetical protein
MARLGVQEGDYDVSCCADEWFPVEQEDMLKVSWRTSLDDVCKEVGRGKGLWVGGLLSMSQSVLAYYLTPVSVIDVFLKVEDVDALTATFRLVLSGVPRP